MTALPISGSDGDRTHAIPLPRLDELDIQLSEPAADVAMALARFFDPQVTVDHDDVVLAGVVELVANGGRSAQQLVDQLGGMWPGARLNELMVDAVLQAGKREGLLLEAPGLDGTPIYCLTPSGHEEHLSTRTWRDEMYRRVAAQIRGAGTQAFGFAPTEAECHLWAARLAEALTIGIEKSGVAFDGSVQHLDDLCIVPRTFNQQALFEVLTRGIARAEVAELLMACAGMALDPTDPFGTELVTHVVTSFVLHAVVARRGHASEQAVLGSLAGQRLVVDTPVLVQLLAGGRADGIRKTLRTAAAAGLDVVVGAHTLDELQTVIEGAGAQAPDIRDNMIDPEELLNVGRLTDNDVIRIYAEGVAEGLYRTWGDFERAAGSMNHCLSQLGVTVRPHGSAPEQVDECRDALSKVLLSAGKGRGVANIDWDAMSMSMVWRPRRRTPRGSRWPGGWMLTPDRAVPTAMAALEAGDWPFCLTPAQLSALLTRCADVPDVGELTRTTVQVVLRDAADAVVTKFPPAVAIALARTIGEGGRPIETRIVSIPGVLAAVPSPDVPGLLTAARGRRLYAAVAAERERMERERLSAEVSTRETAEQLRLVEAQRDAALQAVTAGSANEMLLADRMREVQEKAAQTERQGARRGRLLMVVAAHAVGAALLLGLGFWLPAIIAGVAAWLTWGQGQAWVREEGGVVMLLSVVAADVLGVCAFLWSLLAPHV